MKQADAAVQGGLTETEKRHNVIRLPRGSIGAVRSCTVMTAAPAPAASDHFPLMAELDV